MITRDVIIVGRGAVALFAARKARQKGLSVLVAGTGEPAERFLLLHENALRVLEAAYGAAPGHPLRGVRVLDARLRPVRDIHFARHGLRLHAMRLSALLAIMRERHDAESLDARVVALDGGGLVTLEDGRRLKARHMVLNTAGGFLRSWLRRRHAKAFRMGFIERPPERDWALQINDRGSYAVIVPFGEDAAVVSSGDEAPLRRLLESGGLAKMPALSPVALETWCALRRRQGRIVHVGEAARRVHPHTAQGLNRALDTVDALLEGRRMWPEILHDCLMWTGGLLLDALWGGPGPGIRLSLRFLDSRPGRALASGTLLQQGGRPAMRGGK
jgi:2-polyprenyl-6-methoxyphenol hydroxylase-like FAD-dependent oxidoreductase